MLRPACLIAVASVALSGCGHGARTAEESASRLLAAVVAGDRAAFDAQIDRAAVREDVRRQLTELARAAALDVEGGPSDFALDRMIGPGAIHLVGAAGERLAAAPTPVQIVKRMKVVDGTHACLRDAEASDRCLLTFAKARGQWRLVGMRAPGLTIRFADPRAA